MVHLPSAHLAARWAALLQETPQVAINTPTLDQISEKWSRNAASAQQDYTAGINRVTDWAGPTAAAETTYNAGVQAAIAQGRFGKGVTAAGTAKWKDRALTLGPQRFATGVAAARPDYQKGFAPFLAVIQQTDLPQRFPRGDAANLERVRTINDRLHQERLSRAG